MSTPLPNFIDEIAAFIATHGQPSRVEVLLPDMHGRLRGKSLPGRSGLEKLAKGGVRLPWGTQALDIWGVDVEGIGVGADLGDPDGVCRAVPGTLAMVRDGAGTADAGPVAQVLVSMEMPDGTPCFLDPRVRLQAVLERFAARGLTPVVAVELEFYLVKSGVEGPRPEPPHSAFGPVVAHASQVYDMQMTDAFAPVLDDIAAVCTTLGISADAATAEFGPGQFEINLLHTNDAASACDQAILFKRVVKQVAVQHGLHATFMAKPYSARVGSGCHVHVSLIDGEGRNVLASPDEGEVSQALRHAVGGCLATARDTTAIFAPYLNSYRRFAPGAFAPAQLNWGGDHRLVAIRVPETSGPAARIEHRLAGADANPYLLVAAILGGMLHGITECIEPDNRVADGATEVGGAHLTHDWLTAIEAFATSDFVGALFGDDYRSIYAMCRRHEHGIASRTVTDFEYASYLSRL